MLAGPQTVKTLVLQSSILVLLSLSRSTGVTHWKLQDNAVIVPASAELATDQQTDDYGSSVLSDLQANDPEFALLLRHTTAAKAGATKATVPRQPRGACPVVVDVDTPQAKVVQKGSSGTKRQCSSEKQKVAAPRNPDGSGIMTTSAMASAQPGILTCGEPVEFTVYDFLKGIARRSDHMPYPEPEVAMIFKKSDSDNSVDLFDVELGLKKAYQENPESLTVLNQIGNYWRIKGNTQLAVECFRKALSISPDHPDLLLNLARVLFNLKFYDDAIFLAKRSLHMKSSEYHAWLQYFTLGEVYKAIEKYEEAGFYFRKSLELNPGLQVAEMHLRELGMDQQYSVNAYTLLIIFALICIVLVVMYYLIVGVSAGASRTTSRT